jgi:hypothetical protein
MAIEFTVSLVDLKRAFRRVSTRLQDEIETGAGVVSFVVTEDSLKIMAGETSETLNVKCLAGGSVRIPINLYCGIARALPLFRKRLVEVAVSAGTLRIDRTDFRHPDVSVSADTILSPCSQKSCLSDFVAVLLRILR